MFSIPDKASYLTAIQPIHIRFHFQSKVTLKENTFSHYNLWITYPKTSERTFVYNSNTNMEQSIWQQNAWRCLHTQTSLRQPTVVLQTSFFILLSFFFVLFTDTSTCETDSAYLLQQQKVFNELVNSQLPSVLGLAGCFSVFLFLLSWHPSAKQ